MHSKTDKNIAEIRRLKLALRESRHMHRFLFDNNSEAIIIADARTRRLVDCNKKALELTGYSRKKFLFLHAYRLYPRSAKRVAMESFRKMARGKAVYVETEILRKDGNIVPVRITGTPFQVDEDVRIFGVFTDITDRKKADELTRENENKYRLLFEESHDAIFVADARTRMLIDCNKKAEELIGYPKRELLSMRADDLHPKELVRQTMKGFKKQVRGVVRTLNSQVLTKGGRRVDVLISASALEIGGMKLMIGVFKDITERKKAEDALRQSEERYRTLAESAEDAIFIIDREYRYVYMNTYCAKTLDAGKRDFIGRNIKDTFPAAASKKVINNNMGVFKSGKPLFIIEKLALPGGERWLDTRLSPIKDENGKTIYVAGIARDITLQKKAEEVLKRSNEELERIVQVRSLELLGAQDKLNKGKRLADVGRLSATIAHELRNPFAAIRTAAYNIKMKSMDPRLQSHLANIDKKILESDQIIKNLLYYSSIKAPQTETFYFCRMMDECVALSKEIYSDHKVLIKRICKCGRDLKIEGDPIQLKEVFNNLLNNAYEAFDDKGGRIEIKAQADKEWLNVRIKDNGPGVDPKVRGKVFEPFFTTKVRGMGLGLPLCSQIISLHNGTINMTSKPGKGTAIEVKLPTRPKVEKSQKKVL